MIERILQKIEEADSKLSFGKPETVGKTTVFRVKDEEGGSQTVVLSLGENAVFEVFSQYIDGVPEGYVKEGQQVEILVRKDKPVPSDALINKLLKRKHNPLTWFMAIRPFGEETFGKPVGKDDTVIWEMFEANFRSVRLAPAFHEMFLEPTRSNRQTSKVGS